MNQDQGQEKDVIFQQTMRFVCPLIMVLAFLTFWRGHHLPGGAFIAGLMSGSAIVLRSLPDGRSQIELPKSYNENLLMAIGLCLALASACMGAIWGSAFFQGLWLPEVHVLVLGKVHLGTPLLFDLGVWTTVTSFVIKTIRHYLEMD